MFILTTIAFRNTYPNQPSFELNLDHIQQYLDGTIKISFDNNKPFMIKEGRHSFAGSTVSKDISKRDQDLNEFVQIVFEKPDL